MKSKGIELMFLHVGAFVTPSRAREPATVPADRDVYLELAQLQLQTIELKKTFQTSKVDKGCKAEVTQEKEVKFVDLQEAFRQEVNEQLKANLAQRNELQEAVSFVELREDETSGSQLHRLRVELESRSQKEKFVQDQVPALPTQDQILAQIPESHFDSQVAMLPKDTVLAQIPESHLESQVAMLEITRTETVKLTQLQADEREQWHRAKFTRDKLQAKAKFLRAQSAPSSPAMPGR